jgi:hypothetical protein
MPRSRIRAIRGNDTRAEWRVAGTTRADRGAPSDVASLPERYFDFEFWPGRMISRLFSSQTYSMISSFGPPLL